jgi:hypothetical protein
MPKTLKNKMVSGNPLPYSTYSPIYLQSNITYSSIFPTAQYHLQFNVTYRSLPLVEY